MGISWNIDTAGKMVTAVSEGDVTRADFDRLLDAVVNGGGLPYRKLLDISNGDTSMTPDDVLALGIRCRQIHELGEMGPLAVVIRSDKLDLASRAIGMLAVAKRPMRVFDDGDQARTWIRRQAPV